jgi:beta-glucosidase
MVIPPNMFSDKTKYFFLLILIALAYPASSQTPPVTERIEALIRQMTPEEKAGQLNFIVGETIITGPTMYTSESGRFDDQIRKGTITGLFNVHGAAYTARLQKIAVEESRLGIPLLFGADIIHGFKTVTPIPLGEAASWDLELIERSARLAAEEATSSGINLNFAPMVDISLDPRWGRISEGAGEDPFLGSLVAAARVRGFQGGALNSENTLAACVKHFAAYGAAQGGRDYNTVDMSRRFLYEVYLPPFKAAIDAGAATLMPAFNELDGVPATANHNLLQQILKKEWGFQGLIISDYGAVRETINHGVAEDGKMAAELCLEAGTDLDMMSHLYISQIPSLLKEGRISETVLNDAVRRILKLKFDLGLFDDPYKYSDTKREKATVRSKENLALARDIARRSIVLLKNSGNQLPLNPSVKKIAVIGPLADNKEEMNGSWSFFGEAAHPVSILEGVRSRAGKNMEVTFEKGCELYSDSRGHFDNAVAAARKADIVLMVLGESAVMNGEGASRAEIGLPGVQEQLVQAVHETGKPIVLILINGRPLTLNWVNDNIPAILETWTLGSEAGTAVADVLFGDYNPSGKLPVSFPRSVGQIPLYYFQKNTGRPYSGKYDEPADQRLYISRYRDVPNSALYPFGFGLSYSKFVYSDVRLSSVELSSDGTITVSVDVTNASDRAGEEVVQLYIRDVVGSVTRPVKELKGFRKVMIKAGETAEVSFQLTAKDLAFYRADMTWGTEPGKFDVFVGGDSENLKKGSFDLR